MTIADRVYVTALEAGNSTDHVCSEVFNSPSGVVLLGTSWVLKNKPTVKDCNLSLVYRKIAVKGLGQREGIPGSLTVG